MTSRMVQNVLDAIVARIPGGQLDETVDVVKAGDPSQPVTGIVTTFLATYAVLQRAVDLGANLVITHEPIFYNHLDETDWLEGDPVYTAKRQWIEKNGLVVWRFHDYWHRHQPDGILAGITAALGWQAYADPSALPLYTITPTPLGDLAKIFKKKLDISMVRVVGALDMPCRRVGVLVGAAGGRFQMHALRRDMDVLVVGELNEWETCEYVRDAIAMGQQKALIVLGHANSEEAGMAWLVDWLADVVPGVRVTHVPAGDPFRFV